MSVKSPQKGIWANWQEGRQKNKVASDAAFCKSANCPSMYHSHLYTQIEDNLKTITTHLQDVVIPHLKDLTKTVQSDRVRFAEHAATGGRRRRTRRHVKRRR
jgi:hypothetical protein